MMMKRDKGHKRLSFFLLLFMIVFIPKEGFSKERVEILIGVCNSGSGSEASTGNEIRWAFELAASDVNRNGGIYVREVDKKLPVRLLFADDESDAAVAAKVTERLIVKDNVDMILGTHPSNLVIASCRVSEKYGVYYHSASCFIPIFLENQFKWATNIFLEMEQATEAPFRIWDSIPPGDRPARHALLMEGTPDGIFFGSHFKNSARNLGYHFTVEEPLPEVRDYLPLALKLKKEKIDSVLIFGDPADCISFVRQIRQVGLNLKYIHGWKGTWTAEFWEALGSDAQYVICDGFWSAAYPYPGAQRLGDLFFQRYKRHSVSVGLFYGGCQILFKAIEAAGTLDSAKIRKSVLETPFNGTVIGNVRYRENGVATIVSTANQWWDGEPRWFYPFNEGAWKLKLMPSPEQRR